MLVATMSDIFYVWFLVCCIICECSRNISFFFSLSAIKLYHKLCVVAGQRSFVFSTPPARTRRAGLIYNTMTWCLPLTRIPIPQELEQRKMHFFVSFLPCYESQITSHRLITCSSVWLWYFSSDKWSGWWVSDFVWAKQVVRYLPWDFLMKWIHGKFFLHSSSATQSIMAVLCTTFVSSVFCTSNALQKLLLHVLSVPISLIILKQNMFWNQKRL